MFADPEKVRSRRWKRRLKAGASIVLAMAAGAFLACKSRLDEALSTTSVPAPSPEAGVNEGAEAGARDAGAMDAGDGGSDEGGIDGGSDEGGIDGGLDAGADAGDAGDGGVKKPRPVKKPQVDKREHQKGLPIRDMIE